MKKIQDRLWIAALALGLAVLIGKNVSGAEGAAPASEITPGKVLARMLDQGERVSLAVVVKSVTNLPGASISADWAKSKEDALLASVTETMLTKYSGYPGFALIDTDAVAEALSEMKPVKDGYAREINVARMGQTLRATHLLVSTLARFEKDGKVVEKETYKLIRVEDSALMAMGSRESK